MQYHLPRALAAKFLDQGREICRSLWDRETLIAHLDVEYVNFDFPAESYLDPRRAFELQAPAQQAILHGLRRRGIVPLHLLSGRGHHFVWRIRQSAPVFRELARIGQMPAHLSSYYAAWYGPGGEIICPELGAAFAGLGLVMEYMVHEVREEAAPASSIPIELTALNVKPQQRGREMISLDISEYGDPLNTRMIRVPFSVYLKPWQRWGILNEQIRSSVPLMVMIPLQDMTLWEGVENLRDAERARRLAAETHILIPNQEAGMERLVEDYLSSRLAGFHSWFYSQDHDPPESWPATYDRTPIQNFPESAAGILAFPNDALLKPAGIREVVNALLDANWHPRHIAGLIRSKYERNYDWGNLWYFYDAATRADFYTRVFAGLRELEQTVQPYADGARYAAGGNC